MPILPILDESGRLLRGNRAGIIVLATMLYPSDEERRDAHVAAVLQESIMTDDPDGSVPGKIAGLTFKFGGRAGIEKVSRRQFAQGLVAGETLLCAAQLAAFASDHTSLRKAQHIVKEFRVVRKFGARLSIPTSITRLESAWMKFKSVAHLWAAFIPWWVEADDSEVLQDERVADLLADAKWFAAVGMNHIPKHARRPLLDAREIWKIPDSPDIPNVTLEPPRMSETELSSLREYDSTKRH